MTLAFKRNKVVQVEPAQSDLLEVSWRQVDSFLDAEIKMEVKLPDLEIADVRASLHRVPMGGCLAAQQIIQKVVGVRVGPGLRKIVWGLIGEDNGCRELAEGVLECCNAVILHFTLPQIKQGEKASAQGEEAMRERYRAMLRANPRLVRSCVAFQDDSPLMQGLDL